MPEVKTVCDEKQQQLCAQKMETIITSVTDVKKDVSEVKKSVDRLFLLVGGDGQARTGLAPRLDVVEVISDTNAKAIGNLEGRLDKYIEAKTEDERKVTRGVLAAIGTACLSLLATVVSFFLKNLLGGGK